MISGFPATRLKGTYALLAVVSLTPFRLGAEARLTIRPDEAGATRLDLALPVQASFELRRSSDLVEWSPFRSGNSEGETITYTVPADSEKEFFTASWWIEDLAITIGDPPFPLLTGRSATLQATASIPAGEVPGLRMTWTSGDPQVASVHPQNGTVRGEAPGTTEITVLAEEGTRTDTPVTVVRGPSDSPQALKAFFGLDGTLPPQAAAFCREAPGEDGMPLTFTHSLDPDTVLPEHFRIVTADGSERVPLCATLQPAFDANEQKTVLLIGELGNTTETPGNPPVSVFIDGDLRTSEGISMRGARLEVIPLGEGPRYAYAEIIPENRWATEAPPDNAPADEPIRLIQTTWEGGVTATNGDTTGETERTAQRVGMVADDGTVTEVTPFAITDIGDNDNHHELWVAGPGAPLWVEIDAETVEDPRGDPNPEDRIFITHSL